LGTDNIQKGTAAAGEMGDFVWAVAAEKGPSLQINNDAPIPAFKAGSLWVVQSRLNMGAAYKYTWLADGKPIGGANNLPAFGPDSYTKPGVPQGKLTGPIEVPSKIYPDVKANVWFYVPVQWDGVTPLAVQVWGDGQQFTGARPGQWRVLETLDNLTEKDSADCQHLHPSGHGPGAQPAVDRIRHGQRRLLASSSRRDFSGRCQER